jgi:hypothetical protein
MRPRYESPEDLKNERRIADYVENKFGIILRKMPDQYYVDFMAFNTAGEPIGVMEMKRRNNPVDQYTTLDLGLKKWNHGSRFFHENALPFSFVVRFNDGVYFYKYQPDDNKNFLIKWGGRKDRGDRQDEEPMVKIPRRRLKKIE